MSVPATATANTDPAVYTAADLDAAGAVNIIWRQRTGRTKAQLEKKHNSERLCRAAVASGLVRGVMGHNPRVICIR